MELTLPAFFLILGLILFFDVNGIFTVSSLEVT